MSQSTLVVIIVDAQDCNALGNSRIQIEADVQYLACPMIITGHYPDRMRQR